MKKIEFFLALALAMVSTVCTAANIDNKWNVTLPGGQMRFEGKLYAETCSVEVGDRQLTIQMGQISTNRFKAVGEDVNPIAFSIHLQNCNINVSKALAINFSGVTDGKNPDILSVGEGNGIARGVGVVLFNDKGETIEINRRSRKLTKLKNGSNVINLIAKYRATEKTVIGGRVNAQAWFSLTYQ